MMSSISYRLEDNILVVYKYKMYIFSQEVFFKMIKSSM